ncbi:SRPBCC family protein [Candidatus Obscuribacterales bacterium]|jgi:hypothetical protein|nr:SRPBCC family protein [Candidatus Obscuribacterales bacterium]MBX3135135.1 SRPBCC family protein [Candidatus Obscuribacterales bacterium]MBX3150257.1 SRPBCC family protein [Candidatus Obscuribacterales bacterium]
MFARVKFAVVLCSVLTAISQSRAEADNFQPHADAISGSIVVNATPTAVFNAIKKSRYQEPARRRVVTADTTSCVLEENFKGVPVLGDVVCRYKEIEVGVQRIEYQILTSDKFKAFDGAWELEPVQEGKATRLKLSSHVEPQMHVPFAKQLTAMGTKKDIKRRLSHIKDSVENTLTDHKS